MSSRSDSSLRFVDFPGEGDPTYLLPPPTIDNSPFFTGLSNGRLLLRHCSVCHRPRQPPGPVCPYCSSDASDWRAASGHGAVHSWIRYHQCYIPAFAPMMPYVVLTVELDEGARIFGRMAEPSVTPTTGMRVTAVVERWPDDRFVHAFVPADAPPGAAA